ncbi:MAG: right-handed parallel beta-helix repeat-containing protein [Acidobacteria bacterium]|nr:right-handed parallel beta-helix repeat-containing protein [Acidobacteriota bacterium]
MNNFLTAMLIAGATAVVSQAAPIPVNSCDVHMNVPGGEYVLTTDLNCPSIAARITADGVVFDMQGFSITKSGVTQGAAIITAWGPACVVAKGIQVKNGTISNYGVGVSLCVPGGVPVKTSSQVKNMKFVNNAMGVALFNAADNEIMHNEVTGYSVPNGSAFPGAIYLQNSRDNSIKNNVVTGSGYSGINLASGSRDNIVKNNKLESNAANGIRVDAGSQENEMKSNEAKANGQFDLFDGNNACGTNTWKTNTYVTRNQLCIQ